MRTDAEVGSGRALGATGIAAAGACLALVACSPPTVFDVQSSLEPRTAQTCVVHELVDRGYRVTENNRRDGFVRGERPGRFLGFTLSDEWDVIEVFVLDGGYGETTIQYMAGRLDYDDHGVELKGPRDDVEETARDIAYRCSD